MVVESNIGTAVNTGSSLYLANAGQVVISFDSAGRPHFNSVAPIQTNKTLDVRGGVVGSPANMVLSIKDAF